MYVGDSGSFFIGFWIAYFIIEYIVNYPGSTNYFNIKLENFPVIAIALLSMPILDLVRVVFLRIINLQSPFSKDKRWHLHHILLDKGMSHNKISLFLTFVSCFNCVVIFLLEPNFNSIELTKILFIIGFFWLSIFEYIRRFKNFIP
jgi:UDP-N-acetylmuramyl pentapeptide phosphotransferase/UDP-N-acetylglucosamine-1-phosphate transferase